MTPDVFEPWMLGSLRLRNRIIRSATHEGMAHADGMPTDALERTWRRLAEGGAGAIITGYVGVKRNGRTLANMRMFDHDGYIDVYRGINDRLKEFGTPIIAQLAHGGSRSSGKLTGQDVVGPSARRKNDHGDPCREADPSGTGCGSCGRSCPGRGAWWGGIRSWSRSAPATSRGTD